MKKILNIMYDCHYLHYSLQRHKTKNQYRQILFRKKKHNKQRVKKY